MNSHEKSITYYMSLPYRTELVKIPDEKGGGFMACLPQFGRRAAIGDGESIDDALTDLEGSKRALFEAYISEGIEIPEPDTFEEHFSGKFVLRLPKHLHKDLAKQAKENDTSLNSHIATLLAKALYEDRTSSAIRSLEAEIKMLRKDVCNLNYTTVLPVTTSESPFEADDFSGMNAA